MKILVDLRKLSNKPSGIGMYIYNFVKGMINQEGIEIIGITDVIESNEIKELEQGIKKIYCYGSKINKSFNIFRYFNYINDILVKENADFFWEPNYIFTNKLSTLKIQTKLIITVFDITPITNKEFYSFMYRVYFKYFLRKSLNNADIVFFDSNDAKRQLLNYFKLDKRNFVTYVIVNPPDRKHDICDEDYFLFISNIEKRKGMDILLEAYDLYRKQGGGKGLTLAGNCRDDRIKKKIEDLNSKYSNVIYYGYIDENKKEELLAKCSALVYPSYAEGFGIPPIEALYFNKPIIVSDLDVFKEVLNKTANYFILGTDKDDNIKELTKSLFLYENPYLNNTKNILKQYDSSELIPKIINFLNQEI